MRNCMVSRMRRIIGIIIIIIIIIQGLRMSRQWKNSYN